MAADSKQTSNSDKETLPAEQAEAPTKAQPQAGARVGDGGHIKSAGARTLSALPRPKLGKKTRRLLYVIVLVVVLGGGWWIAKDVFHVGDKIYAQAAGHKVYKQDIDKLVGNTKGISDHNAATVLADKYLYEAVAKKAGITVSNKDVVAQFPDVNNKKLTNSYIYQSDYNAVYFNKLLAYNTGLYKGELLVTNFSRNIAFQSPYIDIQKISNPNLGNPAAVAADKTYAYNFITKLYNQIKSHKITFDQAIQMEHSDPQVGEQAYKTEPHSGPFDTSNVYLGATNLLGPKSIQSKLASMKAGQLSAPFAVSVGNSWYNKNITVESYYLVVRMDYTKGSHSGLTWDKYLEQTEKQYGYKVYV